MTKIEWTHIPSYKGETLNCVTGCTKTSSGCAKCYSEKMTFRLQKMYEAKVSKGEEPGGLAKYKEGFGKVVCHKEHLVNQLYQWRLAKSRSIFVNSMSDTLHKDVPKRFIIDLWNEMNEYEQHIFWILTKRSQRMVDVLKTRQCRDLALPLELRTGVRWTPNIWLGVSVENAHYKYRIDYLRQTGAKIKFLSLEPLLGHIGTLDLSGIDMTIVGCETGSGARYMNPEWAREIRDQCREQGVKFFMKAMSHKEPIPDDLMIREFPCLENV